MADLKSVKDVAEIVQALVTAAGITVGAIAAYYKFVKDRVYRPRVNLSLDCNAAEVAGRRVLICRAAATSMGGTKLRLDGGPTALLVHPGVVSADPHKVVAWDKIIAVAAVFNDHIWIESGETIKDVAVLTLPDDGAAVYQVELLVAVRRGYWLREKTISVSTFEAVIVDPRPVLQPTANRDGDSDD